MIDKAFDELADMLSNVSKRDPANAAARQRALSNMNEKQLLAFAKKALKLLEQFR
jgi:hypothetical protein